jgi:hypothetical protein
LRWRQIKNRETGKYEMIPLDESAAKRDDELGIIVRGRFDAFKSPIDGSIIGTHREYMDHCKRHNVVPAQEFNPEFFERKAKEREAFFKRNLSGEEQRQRKMAIHELINQMERQNA